jgi:hypothetical protein
MTYYLHKNIFHAIQIPVEQHWLSGSGFALKKLDPDPDPHEANADPQHWFNQKQMKESDI